MSENAGECVNDQVSEIEVKWNGMEWKIEVKGRKQSENEMNGKWKI